MNDVLESFCRLTREGDEIGEISIKDKSLVVGNLSFLFSTTSFVSSIGIAMKTLNGWAGKSKSFRLGGIMDLALYPRISMSLSCAEPSVALLDTEEKGNSYEISCPCPAFSGAGSIAGLGIGAGGSV